MTAPETLRCATHPDAATNLRCGKCGKPICPKCLVQTPVGARCRDCARLYKLPTYRISPAYYLRAIGTALGMAVVLGLVWGFVAGLLSLPLPEPDSRRRYRLRHRRGNQPGGQPQAGHLAGRHREHRRRYRLSGQYLYFRARAVIWPRPALRPHRYRPRHYGGRRPPALAPFTYDFPWPHLIISALDSIV